MILLNHLKYWTITLVCPPITIKEFRYSSHAYAKIDLIASKVRSFSTTPKIKQLFSVTHLLFMTFLVLIGVPISFTTQNERVITDNGLIITLLFTNIFTTAYLSKMFLILPLCIRYSLFYHHLFKTASIWFKNSTH